MELNWTTSLPRSIVTLVVCLLVPPAIRGWQQPASDSYNMLVKQYCTAGHSGNPKTANVSLENADLSNVATDSGLWERVLRKVAANQMPPSGVPRPSGQERRAFTS